MKDDDLLRTRLSELAVPEPSPEARDRALNEAVRELHASSSCRQTTVRPSRRFFSATPRWTLAAGLAAALLVIAFAIHFSARRPAGGQSDSLAAERVLLLQMETLFGPQLDAVVESADGSPDIHLAANPTGRIPPSTAQSVLILFHRSAGGTVRVLSYSGRTVCVTLDGRQVCFEALATGEGKVILSGPTFCWTPGQPDIGLRGYWVTARLLSPS